MTKEEENLIIAEQNKSTEEILKAVTKMKADYHELCKLKDMRIAELEKENAELKQINGRTLGQLNLANGELIIENEKLKKEITELKEKLEGAEKTIDYWKDSSFDWRHKCTSRKPFKAAVKAQKQLTNAKGIILKLYNAGRDVLMCRAEEKAYDNLEEAINDRSIEQFLKEVEE